MRPRAKRSLALVAIPVLGIVGAVVVFAVASSRSSGRGGSTSFKEVYGTFGAFGVAYGARESQLLTRFGSPDQKRNGCWIYRIRNGEFHGIKLIPQIAGMDTVRYCFYTGVVAVIEDHWRPGTYNAQQGPWLAPVTWGCGNGPCRNQAP
jgi:hypothetical protein